LRGQIEKWKSFISNHSFAETQLRDLCRTLLVGRENYSVRTGRWVRSKEELVSFLEEAEDSAQHVKPGPWALRIGDIQVTGFEELIGWEKEWKSLRALFKQVGGYSMWRRFRMPVWSEQDATLFSTMVSCIWIQKLLELGFAPDLVVGEGKGVYVSLVASGIVSREQMALLLAGKLAASELSLMRPNVACWDSASGNYFLPNRIKSEDLQSLFEPASREKQDDYAVVVDKARLLFHDQHTFRNSMLEWDEALQPSGFTVARLLEEEELLSSRQQGLLYVLIQLAVRKINRKWDIQLSGHQEQERITAVLSLAADDVLPKEMLIKLFLEEHPDWGEASRVLQKRLNHSKEPSSFIEPAGLEEVSDVQEWLEKAVNGTGKLTFPEKYSWLNLGYVHETNQQAAPATLETVNCPSLNQLHSSIGEIASHLWLRGVEIDWTALYPEGTFSKVPLPLYVYDRKRYKLQAARERFLFGESGQAIQQPPSREGKGTGKDMLVTEISSYIRSVLADKLDLSGDELRGDAPFEEIGIDSFVIHEFNHDLERAVGSMSKTLLFEYGTADELAEYLASEHGKRFAEKLLPEQAEVKPATPQENSLCLQQKTYADSGSMGQEDIAIVGVSCRYPGADTLEQYWKLLRNGSDMVTEIPMERWDWRDYYDSDPARAREGKSYSKWGAFLEGVDRFDPLFFGISPKEAETMDPQERIFLQTAWETLEDAGYTPEELRAWIERNNSADIGVFVGATTFSYLLWGPQLWSGEGDEEVIIPTSLPWSIANRVSYSFNFQGPSMPVDTACSASLSAIHLACESLRRRECSAALAGGINLYLHPSKYVWLSQMRMLSPTGKCHSFGAAGDGFVPGEGSGAILLKPLSAAIRDGDSIYGVIKGTAMNHGGRTNGYTVPSPNGQADVVKAALRNARINANSITYVEAHGTGTALGDPIEIAGLSKAFGMVEGAGKPCAIGSVKSNIGHLEAAAGIAGVTKILLQMKHRELVPTLHSDPVNANIDFKGSPFRVQRRLEPWIGEAEEGEPRALRAGISSFGAGGANAHIVLEEYPTEGRISASVESAQQPVVVILSAATEEQLETYADSLLSAIELESPTIKNMAYTLQVGRRALEHRLAAVVTERQQLIDLLLHYKRTGMATDGLYLGHAPVSRNRNRQEAERSASPEDVTAIARHWVSGGAVDWHLLYSRQTAKPRRIALPTYPFARESYWVPVPGFRSSSHFSVSGSDKSMFQLALEKSRRDERQGEEAVTYSTMLTGREYVISDHYVGDKKVLPGVAYVEMARSAAGLLLQWKLARITQIVLISPIIVDHAEFRLFITLKSQQGKQQFEIYSYDANDVRILHGQGLIEAAESPSDMSELPSYDVEAIKRRCNRMERNKQEVYRHLRAIELNLRASFQSIEYLAVGDDEAIALIELPSHLETDFDPLSLHPALMDGALQVPPAGEMRGVEDMIHLPYTISSVTFYRPLTTRLYSYTRLARSKSSRKSAVPRFDVDLLDESGQILVSVIGFLARPVQPETFRGAPSVQPDKLKIAPSVQQAALKEAAASGNRPPTGEFASYEPIWVEERIDQSQPSGSDSPMWLLFDGNDFLWQSIADTRSCVLVKPGDAFRRIHEKRYEINPGEREDYARLLNELSQDKLVPVRIIISWGETGLSADEGRLQNQLRDTAYALLYLSQALTRQKLKEEIRLLYMYQESNGTVDPIFSALSGMMTAFYLENPRFLFRVVALCDQPIAANIIEDEFSHWNHAATAVRYGEGKRWSRRYRAFDLEQEARVAELPSLRQDGVYLFTGGMGGLGRLFAAEWTARNNGITFVLIGRSPAEEQMKKWLSELSSQGAKVHYCQGDLSSRDDTFRLIGEVKERFGRIHGVIHAAGVIRDAYYFRKTDEMVQEVLAPKVFGTVWLDEALAEEPLDYFILFSSSTAVLGNYGQTDYAYANGFLDAFAHWREIKKSSGERMGKTLSLNWPLWREGGMHVDAVSEELLYKQFGMAPLATASGLFAFEQSLKFAGTQLLVMEGNIAKANELLHSIADTGQTHEQLQEVRSLDSGKQENNSGWMRRLEQQMIEIVSQLLKIPVSRIQPERELAAYGFDSIQFVEFANRINKQFHTEVTPADFFEYQSIADFVPFLEEEYGEQLEALFAKKNVKSTPLIVGQPVAEAPASITKAKSSVDSAESISAGVSRASTPRVKEPIAIIGMSGILPESEDLAQFWDNLLNGNDLITEIPPDRWDWRATLGDPGQGNKTNSKWGGFIPDIDKFDAKFFGISPREAELMDPQQRILLQTVWKTIEDAGYKASDLSKTRTGLYVGVSTNDYMELLKENGVDIQAYTMTGNLHSILVNRISYLLNLNGPSFPIDTACSSSLVAIRQAVEGLWNGSCRMALVAGVNALLSPTIYISFAKAGMLSPDGRCKTFDQSANGYVRAEGVGAVLLKPLSQAEADRDHIYAVIRGTSVNHGGKVNTLTTPSPAAQAGLIMSAFEEGDVDPATVSYMEAHGTGTSLGDPIEVNGLKKAFKELAKQRGSRLPNEPFCALGSVKSNIGHLESAAGISGMLKILLAMKHKILPSSLHLQERNPYVQLEDSPFYLLDRARPWVRLKDEAGVELPRRAGVSSFGFGGVNAHVLLEEYANPVHEAPNDEPGLFVLSARSEERLREYAAKLLIYIQEEGQSTAGSAKPSGAANHVHRAVMQTAADVIKLPTNELFADEPISDYGFDGIHFSTLLRRLNDHFQISLQREHYKQYPTLDRLIQDVSYECISAKELSSQRGSSFQDLCYTLQVGREEMEERLAIAADGWQDLKGKLKDFVNGVESREGVFRGKSVQEEGQSLSLLLDGREGKQFLNILLEDRNWRKIGQLWVSGMKMDWRLLHPEGEAKRISLPTYPFSRDRHWFKPAVRKPAAETTREPKAIEFSHPLIGKLDLSRSLNQGLVFVFQMDAAHPLLRDHKIAEAALFPGVGVLEMAGFALRQLHPDAVTLLEDIVWIKPLKVVGKTEFQLVLVEEGEKRYRFQLEQTAHGEGAAYASGYVKAAMEGSALPSRIHLGDVISACESKLGQSEIYHLLKQVGLDYGTYYRGIQEFWIAGSSALSRLQLPSGYEHEAKHMRFQTSLMDSALQTVAGMLAHQERGGAKLILPFSVEQVEWCAPLPPHCYVHVETIESGQYDVSVLDDQGRICTVFRRFMTRSSQERQADAKLPERFFYKTLWQHSDLEAEQKVNWRNQCIVGATLLVTKPGLEAWGNAVRQLLPSESVVEVELGESTFSIGSSRWSLDSGDSNAWTTVLKQLPKVSRVIYLGGLQTRESAVGDPWKEESSTCIMSLFHLLKGLSDQQFHSVTQDFYVLTSYAASVHERDVLEPYGAGLHGLVMSAAKEYNSLAIRLIDVDGDAAPESHIHKALEEPPHPHGEPIALRGDGRYVRRLSPASLQPSSGTVFQPGGVYIIIGGAGGIGLALSQHLALTANSKIVLVGRSELNDGQEHAISEIENAGGEVLYIRGDVARIKDMLEVKRQTKARFGKIDGVVHAAIVLNDKIIDRMDEGAFRAVITPKIEGSITLHEAFGHEPLSFMMFFSSAQSFTGSAGQSNYSAASTFVDAYARYIDQQERYPVYSVNWGYWGEIGVVATGEYQRRLEAQGIYSVPTNIGLQAIESILSNDARTILAIHASPALIQSLEGGCVMPKNARSIEAFQQLEQLCDLLLLHKFQGHGLFRSAGESVAFQQLQGQLAVIPKYIRLLQAMLNRLENAGWVQLRDRTVYTTKAVEGAHLMEQLLQLDQRKEQLKQRYPEIEAHLSLLNICMEECGEVMNGTALATDVMFPGSSLELVEPIYAGSYYTDHCNQRVAETVLEYIRKYIQDNRSGVLNILEVGAGTGGTSSVVLESIKDYGRHVRYYYTDISAGFTQHGRRRFGGNYPFVQFQPLSINRDIKQQGYEKGSMDIIIAANVMHATSDIRYSLQNVKSLLKLGGLLILNELTEVQTFHTLTFGLLEGWWLFEDEPLRLVGSPLLAAADWERLLLELSISDFKAWSVGEAATSPQQVLTAIRQPEVRQETLSNSPNRASVKRPVEPDIQHKLKLLLSHLLGMEPSEISTDRAFTSYGVDSIVGVEFINAINREFDVRLKTMAVYDNPNVNLLTIFLNQQLVERKNQSAPIGSELNSAQSERVYEKIAASAAEAETSRNAPPSVELIADTIADQLAASLGSQGAELDRKRPFSTYGVDSIVGIELVNHLNEVFQIALRTIAIFDHPSIQDLAAHIYTSFGDRLQLKQSQVTYPVRHDPMELLNRLESGELSLEEVSRELGGSIS
jgi:polyketide synthase PksN